MSDTSAPGSDLGLPTSGPGRIAGWGRRVIALVLDWGLSYLAALALAGGRGLTGDDQFLPLAVFAVEVWVGTSTLGGGLGQLLVGLRVAPVSSSGRGPVGPVRAALRTLLLVLVIPAVVFDADRRGLHDRAAGTVVLSRR